MDSRFYINYLIHKNDYIKKNAVITNIDFYHSGKSGSYQSSLQYYVEGKYLTGNIRTALGDTIGKEITIGINKYDYSKILPSRFTLERKTIFHSFFMGIVILYSIYLIIDLFRKRKHKSC